MLLLSGRGSGGNHSRNRHDRHGDDDHATPAASAPAVGSAAAATPAAGCPAAAANRHSDRRRRRRLIRDSVSQNGTIGLREYLVRLATEPASLAAFVRDPDAAAADAGLDRRGRDALAAADVAPMWNALLDRTNGSARAEPSVGARLSDRKRESLIVVGTGICAVGQLTVDAIAYMKESDVVLYLVGDPVAEGVIRSLNPAGAMSLRGYYGEGVERNQSYEAMVQHILSCVRAGKRTCVAFYGHPGVFAYPAHEAIRRARKEGYIARMLPGVSAEDCLFADLNVDPAVNGCQSIEASDFLVHEKVIDTSCALVLWQVGVVGDWTYRTSGYELGAFPLFIEKLTRYYGAWHEVTIYEAATLPELKPKIIQIAIGSLTPAYVTAGSTMYVPPARKKTLDATYGSVLAAR
jgi:Tetrapyrrole (Corrin/Porphyrin) Methylases